MKRAMILGALLGGLTSLSLTGLFYLGDRLANLPFVPFDLFDWLARVLPGNLVTLGIDTIVSLITALNLGATGDTAKLIEQLLAIGLVIGGGVIAGIAIGALARDRRPPAQAGLRVGVIAFVIVAAIELSFGLAAPLLALPWLALLIIGWGWLVGKLLALLTTAADDPAATRPDRRTALLTIAGGSLGVVLAAWGLGRGLGAEPVETGAGEALTSLTPEPQDIQTPATALDGRLAPAPGTRQELTPDGEFYRIDINTRPLAIARESWQLEVAGLFDQPRNLTLDDLMAYPAVTQTITLSCISNRIAGDLIGTANWTGARLGEVLVDLGLRPEARELFIEAADGFYESVATADLMDPRTLLVYGMNGQTLPERHGFPLRIYIPNRYGMKQPKWITRIEAIDVQGPGYWVQRGWSQEARPQIVSVIDSIAKEAAVDGRVPVGGIAWAGDRGIENVEIQVGEGAWQEVTLRTPPLSALTWVQWRYDWPVAPGRHTFRVRATDGDGALQIEAFSDVRPDGATGYHSVTESF